MNRWVRRATIFPIRGSPSDRQGNPAIPPPSLVLGCAQEHPHFVAGAVRPADVWTWVDTPKQRRTVGEGNQSGEAGLTYSTDPRYVEIGDQTVRLWQSAAGVVTERRR